MGTFFCQNDPKDEYGYEARAAHPIKTKSEYTPPNAHL